MNYRTWPYGTRKDVVVRHFERKGDFTVTIVEDLNSDPKILSVSDIVALYHKPVVGQQRVIEFRHGGPTGGHWTLLDGLDTTQGRSELCQSRR